MTSSIRYGLLMVLILALLIPGVYGITVGTLSGDATGTAGSATTYKSPSGSAITTALALGSGPKIFQAITGSGSLSQQHSASNKDLSWATVSAAWSDSQGYTYSYSMYPDEGTGLSSSYVQANEALSVDSAVDLIAFAEASNKEGDYAHSWVSADYGTLGGYTNSARADKSSAATTQAANYANLAVAPIFRSIANTAAGQNIAGKFNAPMPSSGSLAKPVDPTGLGTGFYSAAYYSGGVANSYLQVYDPDALGAYHAFAGYSDSAKSTKSSASISQGVKSTSGNWVQWGGSSYNSEGDSSATGGGFGSGLMSGYSGTETTAPTSASVSQSIVSLAATGGSPGPYGQGFDVVGGASNAEGDYAGSEFDAGGPASFFKVSLNGYTQSASAKKSGTSESQKFASASGDMFFTGAGASNAESDRISASLGVNSGHISTYSDSENAAKSSIDTSVNFKAFEGYQVDLSSHAENVKPADEGIGTPVNYGGADFEIQAKNRLAAGVKNTASLKNGVLITPTLPAGTNTAILLEPVRIFANYAGATDLGGTVFPTLVGKGYAMTRYYDSAASVDTYKTLNKYNIALVVGHMNPSTIGLSTSPGYITASQLGSWYTNPPKKSFVILNGCQSFGGYPNPSPLAKAVSKASLSGGFDQDVGVVWSQDYQSVLFTKMAEGMTAQQANDYVMNVYRPQWMNDHPGADAIQLDLFGNGGFTL